MKKIFLISATIFLLIVLFFSNSQALVFYPVKYKFWTSSVSMTVGKSVDMPIYVQNLGLLADIYNVNVTYPGEEANPNIIKIENAVSQTEQLSTYRIGKTSARLTLMSATASSITLRVYVTSTTDAAYNPNSNCLSSSDCSYLGENYYCLSGKCTRFTEIIIKTGMASLPEFNWFGLLQIILLASILAFVKF